jgi:hypothetical protein
MGGVLVDQHVAGKVFQVGIDQHTSSIKEIDTYYWRLSDGRGLDGYVCKV